MASIVFTDSIGAATLTNGKPGPAARFANWVPVSMPVGDSVERESDGARVMFPLRDDWGASFELRGIPAKLVSGVAMLDVADRLRRHLLLGGQCAVHTDDQSSTTYPTCGLAAGATPQLTQSDKTTLEYTLTLALTNLASSPVQMVVRYAGGS